MLTALAIGVAGSPTSATPPDPQHIEFFEKKIRPVLFEHCYKCHSTQATKVKEGFSWTAAKVCSKAGKVERPVQTRP